MCFQKTRLRQSSFAVISWSVCLSCCCHFFLLLYSPFAYNNLLLIIMPLLLCDLKDKSIFSVVSFYSSSYSSIASLPPFQTKLSLIYSVPCMQAAAATKLTSMIEMRGGRTTTTTATECHANMHVYVHFFPSPDGREMSNLHICLSVCPSSIFD